MVVKDTFIQARGKEVGGLTRWINLSNFLQPEFGSIYLAGGSDTQSPGVAYSLCTQFIDNGLSSVDVIPTVASNKITITNTGIYRVTYFMSYIGSNSATTAAAVFWNGVEQLQISHDRTMGAAAAIGVAGSTGFVNVTTGATDIDLRIKTSSGVFDIKKMALEILRVGSA